jgi:hypothetical protein
MISVSNWRKTRQSTKKPPNFVELRNVEIQLPRMPRMRTSPRNCLKSPVGARNMASQRIEAALFGLF